MSVLLDVPVPLSDVIPSYVYQQYADDANIQALVSAYNELTQAYLDWFNDVPIAIYTSPPISGLLLDWIGAGVYGITRPVFSSLTTTYEPADIDGFTIDTVAIDDSSSFQTGSAVIANDDYYKRVITWHTYIGDGRMTTFDVIRKRVARFLYGPNGSDITLAQAMNVSVAVGASHNDVTITIPSSTASLYFQQALNAGILAFPFQLQPTVVIT